MRLGTLARKLNLNTDEIVSYLIKNGIEIEENPNTKLSQEQIDLVNSVFRKQEVVVIEEKPVAPEKSLKKSEPSEYLQDADDFSFDVFGIAEEMEGFVASVNELSLKNNEINNEQSISAPIENVKENDESLPKEEELSIEELAARDDVKTLRAKKVKLGGIKVVGKIELPEPKKKPELNDSEPIEESDSAHIQKDHVEEKPKGLYGDFVKQQSKINSKNGRSKKGQQNRKQLSFEEKQKREEQRVKREKEREKKALKKKKEAHYKNNVLPKIEPAAPKTKKKAKKVVKSPNDKSKKPEYKNPLKKLWAWLNGEYDKF